MRGKLGEQKFPVRRKRLQKNIWISWARLLEYVIGHLHFKSTMEVESEMNDGQNSSMVATTEPE